MLLQPACWCMTEETSFSGCQTSISFGFCGWCFSLVFPACLLCATCMTRHSNCCFLEVRIWNIGISCLQLCLPIMTNLNGQFTMLLFWPNVSVHPVLFPGFLLFPCKCETCKTGFVGFVANWNEKIEILTKCKNL